MKVINDVIERITEHRFCESSEILAKALHSALNTHVEISLSEAYHKLDDEGLSMICGLLFLREQPDRSQNSEIRALKWLRENGFINPCLSSS